MAKYELYCDESGNSGGNYLDKEQPVYILAGWLIEKNQRWLADSIIRGFLDKYYPDSPELKGATALKSRPGQEMAYNLMLELGKVGCVPFYNIAEKKYCVAGKMVEAYMDSEHNDYILPVFSWMNGVKKNIAQFIYDNSKGSIEKFAEAHNNPSVELLKEAHQLLIDEITENGEDKLAFVVSGASDYLPSILEEETHSLNAYPNKALHTLNLPVFVNFIQMIERFATQTQRCKSKHKITNLKLIHDETKQFQETYPEVFSLYKRAERTEFVLENGATIIMGFKHLNKFEMRKSVETPMIQAADLLASSIGRV